MATKKRRMPARTQKKQKSASALHKAISALHSTLAGTMRRRWHRDLPLNELLGDRWQRAEHAGFGAGASVYDSCCIFGDVAVGAGTWIGPFTILDGSGGLRIGSHCSISSGVMIYTHDSVHWALSGGQMEPDRAPVAIGDRCYIGSQVVVAKGVTIGERCVIGAGAFVNRDLPPLSIAAGVPARIIGRVEVDKSGGITLRYCARGRKRR
jgi:acetyltransferase-like isoleucine patch superfamily enzyme